MSLNLKILKTKWNFRSKLSKVSHQSEILGPSWAPLSNNNNNNNRHWQQEQNKLKKQNKHKTKTNRFIYGPLLYSFVPQIAC